MKRAKFMAVALAAVYFLLSFNAYACLIPLYGGIEVTRGSDCATPKEQPARQHCDAFKALGVQGMSSVQPLPDSNFQGVLSDLPSIPMLASVVSLHLDFSGSPPFPGRDPLSLTSILRI